MLNLKIDNKELLKNIIEYQSLCIKKCEQFKVENPDLEFDESLPIIKQCALHSYHPDVQGRVAEYLGNQIYRLCFSMARRPNFYGYTWKEDMIGDAVMYCTRAIRTMDTNYSNAHAYLSMTVHNAFVQRLVKENKHLDIVFQTLDSQLEYEMLNPEYYTDVHKLNKKRKELNGNDD